MKKSYDQKRLLLVDPKPFTRKCLAELLREAASDFVVQEAASTVQVSLPDLQGSDIIVLNHNLPADDVVADLKWLKIHDTAVPVAVLGSLSDMDAAIDLVRQGVRAYLSPALGIDQIVTALRLVLAGGICIGPTAGQNGCVIAPELGVVRLRPNSVTPREADVLDLLRQGKPNKVIAYELQMSENTVKVHVARILKKLKASNRTAVVSMPSEARPLT